MGRLGGIIVFLLLGAMFVYGNDKAPDELVLYEQDDPEVVWFRSKVINTSGKVLAGANVLNRNSGKGTVVGTSGEFVLSALLFDTLQVSYVGYKPELLVVSRKVPSTIVLSESPGLLRDVVITALGIEKKRSALTYDVVQLDNEQLTRVKDPNLMVGLTGKAAGVQINKSASGMGASTKVVIRGIRSVAGNNQPLYVVDGVPILNTSNEQPFTAVGGVADAGNRDGGDGISNLNPEDIEDISILKGASASALYGSEAANGVVLITTKKGKAGKMKVLFSTNLTFEKPFCLPRFQNSYGVSDGVESWGEKSSLAAYDNAGDFYTTGLTSITSVSLTSGNDLFQNYFSYANTSGKGIIDKNRLTRHNINLRETTNLFNGLLRIDGNINLIQQTTRNKPVPGGFYMNPLVGLYRFPRGMDIGPYKEKFEVWDESRRMYVQNWHSDTQDFEQNPYWVSNRIRSHSRRNRAMASLSAEMKLASWLKIQFRGSMDYTSDKLRQEFYASTAPALAGNNGRYVEFSYDEMMMYGDVLLQANKRISVFSLQAALGGSINNKMVNSLRYDSKTASLKYANVFNIANIIMNGSAYIEQQIDAVKRLHSLFGTFQIGYKDQLFLDVTARNDWSSTLAFTPNEKSGFFYPSVGMSWVLSQTWRLPEWISFAKMRGVYSKVGNDIPLFITNPVSHIGAGGEIQPVDAAPFEEMKPEMTSSVELGTEWQFLNQRLTVGATWYKTNTRNQFFQLPAQTGDKYAYRYVNAGDIQNTGLEATVGAQPLQSAVLSWKTTVNFATNKNKVIRLHEELPVFIYGPRGFSSSYAMKLKEGGSFGDIYGKAFRRDENGKIIYETEGEKTGLPQVDGDGNTIKVGNANPRFTLSWNNTFSFKNVSFSFLVDGRFGGDILSQTEADMDLFGVTRATADARDAGYVELEGRRIENVKEFFKQVVGGRAGVTEYYMYDATNVRLREVSLGYTFPQKWMKKTGVVKDLQLSFVARNLFFFYKKAPFDPDLILSTGNDNQGVEVYGMPTTRVFGFNIKCEF